MINLLLAIIYLAFISLGLPDSLLGAAWPSMYPQLGVPVSYAGIVSMIIAAGTIVSSLQSDRLTRRLGAGKVTAISVAMTAAALLGFSVSGSFWLLCLWAIPYGLGAGSVDAALNNYVALHYKSWHMSYRYIGYIQLVLTAFLFISLPLWKKAAGTDTSAAEGEKALSLRQVLAIPGAKEVMVCFFCYCALEQTAILWAGSYLHLYKGMTAEAAASHAGLFFIGITAGRGVSGFVSMKLSDKRMIRLGQGIIALGVAALLIPGGELLTLAGLCLVGLGCAPIYPCIIHSTPGHFGAQRSQALIGVQMACAYVGSCLAPPLFGLIANHVAISLLPFYLLLYLVLMTVMHESLNKKAPIQ